MAIHSGISNSSPWKIESYKNRKEEIASAQYFACGYRYSYFSSSYHLRNAHYKSMITNWNVAICLTLKGMFRANCIGVEESPDLNLRSARIM